MYAYRRLALRRRVVINLTDSTVFSGVLRRKAGPLLELADAKIHERGDTTPVDGVVVVERARVSFIQVLDPS